MFLLVGMCAMTLLHLLLVSLCAMTLLCHVVHCCTCVHCCDKVTGKHDLRGKNQELGEFGSQHEYWASRHLWPLEERRKVYFVFQFEIILSSWQGRQQQKHEGASHMVSKVRRPREVNIGMFSGFPFFPSRMPTWDGATTFKTDLFPQLNLSPASFMSVSSK